MINGGGFDHILENSQRVLRLNAQCKNHPYVEEFTKECNVMFIYGTYVLERRRRGGGCRCKISLGDIWKLFQEDHLPKNTGNCC